MMKKSSYCYTISSTMQAITSSINSIPDINESICHILLSLIDLSLIYSCRLHGQSICHATRLINLHTSCIPRDQEICLSTTQLIHPHTSHVLQNGEICLPAGSAMGNLSISYTIDQSAYQLHALQWRNLRTYWPLNWLCVEQRSANYISQGLLVKLTV